jgi:hypothetical protein
LLYARDEPALEADEFVGVNGALLAPDALAPRIGIGLFYLILLLLIFDLIHI